MSTCNIQNVLKTDVNIRTFGERDTWQDNKTVECLQHSNHQVGQTCAGSFLGCVCTLPLRAPVFVKQHKMIINGLSSRVKNGCDKPGKHSNEGKDRQTNRKLEKPIMEEEPWLLGVYTHSHCYTGVWVWPSGVAESLMWTLGGSSMVPLH